MYPWHHIQKLILKNGWDLNIKPKWKWRKSLWPQKKPNISLDFMKIIYFCSSKELLREWNDKPETWRKYPQIIYVINSLFRIYKEFSKLKDLEKKKRMNNKKWAKDLNTYFPKDGTGMANKYKKRCSILLVIRKMQGKIL